MMRLAFLYRRLAREGGTEGDLYRSVQGLAERGHEVHLFCADVRAPIPRGVAFHRVPVVRSGRLARLLSFAWAAPRIAARAGAWDVVIGFGRTPRQDVVRCGGGTHREYLATMAGYGARRRSLGPYHRAILRIERRQFSAGSFRVALAVSRRVAAEIRDGYAVDPGRVRVVYNGVDLERFCPDRGASRRRRVRERFGIPLTAPVVVSVGSGFRRKGIDGLLRLWREGPPREAWLLVVGGDERLGAYQRAAADPGLHGRVCIVGPQSVVEDFYAAADVVVVASLQEAFGNVVLEGLAMGLPVVTSAGVGAAELLHGSLEEFVAARPDDLDGLRARLARALAADRGEVARLTRQVAEAHPWSQHFVALERLLEETAAGRV
jgi:UDP-glucose:(heptosyl)LPS alpha-1,3-glucosyltransferase